jgi:hypothetical protein
MLHGISNKLSEILIFVDFLYLVVLNVVLSLHPQKNRVLANLLLFKILHTCKIKDL